MLWLAVLFVGGAVAAVLWLVPLQSQGCCLPPGVASPSAEAVPSVPADAVPLTVASVWDGDTIRATAQRPGLLPVGEEVRVRLIGVDTPEISPVAECWSQEARDTLLALTPVGSTVWAAPDTEPRDRYDRWLLYLWTDDGRFVNHELVAAGAAEALLVEPNGAHFALLHDAEEYAFVQGTGRWGVCG